jgi:hypothetical protein
MKNTVSPEDCSFGFATACLARRKVPTDFTMRANCQRACHSPTWLGAIAVALNRIPSQNFDSEYFDSDYNVGEAFMALFRTVRRCTQKPLVDAGRTFIALRCEEWPSSVVAAFRKDYDVSG